MKKNDIFAFTAPNGVEVTAVVIELIAYEVNYKWAIKRFVCYAQNRIFTYEESHCIWDFMNEEPKSKYGKVLVDYAILPEYDTILEDYQHQQDMANDYADKTL